MAGDNSDNEKCSGDKRKAERRGRRIRITREERGKEGRMRRREDAVRKSERETELQCEEKEFQIEVERGDNEEEN